MSCALSQQIPHCLLPRRAAVRADAPARTDLGTIVDNTVVFADLASRLRPVNGIFPNRNVGPASWRLIHIHHVAHAP
jgi:hypothetical protein